MERIVFHIDVNSAFLSWTSVDNLRTGKGPDLRSMPAIIGGDQASRRGIVLAKSQLAKSLGIATADPIVSAVKKCPDLVVAPADHQLYRHYSHKLMDYLYGLTPDIEQVSIDECYMDFSGIAHLYKSPSEAAVQIKNEIYNTFGFTVNIGISSNKLLAKMASDFEKPNKVHTLFPHEIQTKMWPLPVEELYMAGKSSVNTLHKLGIRTIGELACTDLSLLESHLKSHGKILWEYANGLSQSPVRSSPQKVKGVGNSTTLAKDVTDGAEARAILRGLAESVSRRLRKAGLISGSLCVEIKYSTFVSVSHQMPLDPPLNTTDGIYRCSCALFSELWNDAPIRLLGIRAAKLLPKDTPVQLSLFDLNPVLSSAVNEKQKKLDAALDAIRSKYGGEAVVRGSMLKGPDHL